MQTEQPQDGVSPAPVPADHGAVIAVRPPRAWTILANPCLPALLAALCYLNTLGNDFVYDDERIVRNNPRIREPANIRNIWLSEWWHDAAAPAAGIDTARDRLYRPLTTQSFALNYALHGATPFGFHLVNLLLHALCSGLVFSFGRRLLGEPAPAMLAALLFAVHPVHVEAVAQVVGRAEILAAIFLLLGLILLLPAGRTPGTGRAWAAAGSFLLAVLSKESAICYLPVALLALWGAGGGPGWRPRRGVTWWLRTAAILTAPLAAYFPLRYVALDGHLFGVSMPVPPVLNPLLDALPPGRIAGAFTILGHYVRLMILPLELSPDYGMGVIPVVGEIQSITLVGLLGAIALLAPLRGYWSNPRSPGQIALLAAITLAGYALISNTLVLIGVSAAERLLYWPSVPALLLISVLAVRAWRRWVVESELLGPAAPVLYGLAGLVLLGLAVRTVNRNADWVDGATLFGRAARGGSPSVQVHIAHARFLMAESQKMTDGIEKASKLREAERHVSIASEQVQRFRAAPRRTSP